MLLIVALVAAVFFLPQDFTTFKRGLEKAVWFNSNSFFAGFGNYFAPANYEQPLLHTWSLAVEIQFYLLIPFLVLLLPIKWLRWVFVSLLLGLTALAEYRLRVMGLEQATYYSLYARLPEFFAGGLAAMYTKALSGERLSAWYGTLGLLMIFVAAIAKPRLGAFPGFSSFLPVIGTVLLLIHPAPAWAGKLLSCKTLIWIGALSYSLYLWHWPVLAFLRYYTGAEVLSVSFSVLFFVLTLLCSVVSFYGVERAFRHKSASRKQTMGWVLLVVSLLGASQTMAKVNSVFTPEELPIEYRRYADPTTICHGQIKNDCLRGDLASDREILVLGDSHAAMLNYFFDYLGKNIGLKARVITASSCVTIPSFDYKRIPDWAQAACINQIQAAGEYIQKSDIIVIAGMWSYQTLSADFNASLKRFIQKNQNKEFIFFLQIPKLAKDPDRVKRFHRIGLLSEQTLDQEYVFGNDRLMVGLNNFSNVRVVDLTELSLFDSVPVYDDKIIYLDSHHLNEVGSILYSKLSEKHLENYFK